MNLNKNATKIVEEMIERQEELKINAFGLENGTRIIDCGVKTQGSFGAGKLFAKACMGGLGDIDSGEGDYGDFSLPIVRVKTESPAISCLASQKAGWSIKGENFFALGSGPARVLAKKPKDTIEKIGYAEESDTAVIALEASKYPPVEVCNNIARGCGIEPGNLYVLIAKTASITGAVQISARMVETALYKIDLLGFDVNSIVKASGSAPVPPIVGDDNKMMGITNDMIIYGSKVFIYSRGEIEVGKIPSNTSEAYGKPFSDIFKEAGYDFYKINPEIFAPAEVQIKNIETNEIKSAGHINPEVIRKSIGMVL